MSVSPSKFYDRKEIFHLRVVFPHLEQVWPRVSTQGISDEWEIEKMNNPKGPGKLELCETKIGIQTFLIYLPSAKNVWAGTPTLGLFIILKYTMEEF